MTAKTALVLLNEKAVRNNLKIEWSLYGEDGPAHDRIFQVNVKLVKVNSNCSWMFNGVGRTIKAAKLMAAENALVNCPFNNMPSDKHFHESKQITQLKELIRTNPNFLDPRASLKQIARILGVEVKYRRLLSCESESYDPILANRNQSVLYNVVAEIVGRQYLGLSNTRSGAEQQASVSCLKALNRSILTIIEKEKYHKNDFNPVNELDVSFLHPEDPVWRLRVLANLHFMQPIFKIQSSCVNGSKGYKCSCFMTNWGFTQCWCKSQSKAYQTVSRLMIEKMRKNQKDVNTNQDQILIEEESIDLQTNNQIEKKKRRSKSNMQFKQDRANLNYGNLIHPITRLENISLAENISKPIYELIQKDKIPLKNQYPLKLSDQKFTYQVKFANLCVQGPESENKRLAKRLVAEAILNKLGYSKQDSNTFTSDLKNLSIINKSDLLDLETKSTNQTSTEEFNSKNNIIRSSSMKILNRSVNKQQNHVSFSCTSDILILDDSLLEGVEHRKFGKYFKQSTKYRKNKLRTDNLNNQTFIQASWSEKSENQASQHSSMKLNYFQPDDSSNSCKLNLQLNQPECNTELGTDQSLHNSNYQQLTDYHKSQIIQKTYYDHNSFDHLFIYHKNFLSNFKLQLLSRLAIYCLKEHFSNSTSYLNYTNFKNGSSAENKIFDLTEQLIILCKHLKINCQFIDYPPTLKSDNQTSSSNSFKHTTVLLIGENLSTIMNTNSSYFLNPNRNHQILIKTDELNRNLAHQKATYLLFKLLTNQIN